VVEWCRVGRVSAAPIPLSEWSIGPLSSQYSEAMASTVECSIVDTDRPEVKLAAPVSTDTADAGPISDEESACELIDWDSDDEFMISEVRCHTHPLAYVMSSKQLCTVLYVQS
jgi:hypothetical protein